MDSRPAKRKRQDAVVTAGLFAWKCRGCDIVYAQCNGNLDHIALIRSYNRTKRAARPESAKCTACDSIACGANLSLVRWCTKCKAKAAGQDGACGACGAAEDTFIGLGYGVGFCEHYN